MNSWYDGEQQVSRRKAETAAWASQYAGRQVGGANGNWLSRLRAIFGHRPRLAHSREPLAGLVIKSPDAAHGDSA